MRIFISALEDSAANHCAALISRIHAMRESAGLSEPIQWSGFGGGQMGQAGCVLLENTVGRAAMLHNVLGQLGYYRRLMKAARHWLSQNKPDLVIVCDSPAFNFHIAKAAKKQGVPVLFYVAPQLWAWAPWRIHKLRRCCDRLACILPFEQEWFCRRGIKAEFVGNPLLDGFSAPMESSRKTYANYRPQTANIALLPGSRKAEIESLWPAMQDIALEIQKRYPDVRFFTAAPDMSKLVLLHENRRRGFSCTEQVGGLGELCGKVDFALVTSGSATLQVAAAGCPMLVMYQSSRLMWHLLGRWLVRIPYFSLPNIVAGRRIVPEFMPYFKSIEPLAQTAIDYLSDGEYLKKTSNELIDIIKPLAAGDTASKVAVIVMQMLTVAR